MYHRKTSFKEDIRKTLIYYALIPTVILTIVGFLTSYFIFFQNITQNNNKTKTEIVNQIDSMYSDYQQFIDYISQQVTELSNEDIKGNIVSLSTQVYSFLKTQNIVGDFYLLNAENEIMISNKNDLPSYLSSKSIYNLGFSTKAFNQPNTIQMSFEHLENNRKGLVMGKVINHDDKFVGLLLFEFNQSLFSDYFADLDQAHWIISDKHGYILHSTDIKFSDRLGRIDKRYRNETTALLNFESNYYIKYLSAAQNQLNIYVISQISSYHSIFLTIAVVLAAIYFMVYSFLLIVTDKIADNKTKVIDQIVESMSNVNNGNFDQKMIIHSEDEFQQIAISYNQMLDKIKTLISDNVEMGRQNVISELKQLETQFDPHFIFNALELIKYMIKMDSQHASKIIVGMSELLRSSLHNKDSLVTLEEDIRYTENYLLIQKYRFENKLNYRFTIEGDIKGFIIPKRTIQPIIENALVHGSNFPKPCQLDIFVKKRNDILEIVICDNGKGFTLSKINELNVLLSQKQNNTKHNGLYNVHRRIQIMYGHDYGLRIEHQVEGSKVVISLPIKERISNYD